MKTNLKSSLQEKLKPGVSNFTLLFLAGVLWAGVGIFLNVLSYSWLKSGEKSIAIIMGAVGLFSAFLIHILGFSHIAKKNIKRIVGMEGKRCFFSFIPWKSYLLITIMMTFGMLIRSSAIPKVYLSPLYTGIGGAMILSGALYFIALFKILQKK